MAAVAAGPITPKAWAAWRVRWRGYLSVHPLNLELQLWPSSRFLSGIWLRLAELASRLLLVLC